MSGFRIKVLCVAVLLWIPGPESNAQLTNPALRTAHLGYAYPAGGQAGTTVEITVGGQYLDGASDAYFSGEGVQAKVLEHIKPMSQKQLNQLRQKLDEARKKLQADQQRGKPVAPKGNTKSGKQRFKRGNFLSVARLAAAAGITADEIRAYNEYRKRRSDPKRQPNPQIDEQVRLQVTIADDATPGKRELRLKTKLGLSNPVLIEVGQFPEYSETEPNDETAADSIDGPLPVIINGQILPGDVDCFRIQAQRGQQLVIAAKARSIVPYLADAVPGWFQATLALFDEDGNEVAYDDDFRFHPDPVVYFSIPHDGAYVLKIRDSIYRGREDFVYRITLGEVPFVTSVFPLGGRAGDVTSIKAQGWNLPTGRVTLDAELQKPGTQVVTVQNHGWTSNKWPLAVGTLPECLDREPNNDQRAAQLVELPIVVNGRIDHPGDWDVFCFHGRAGDRIIAEVQARRLSSPLDSLLRITDSQGRELMANDDREDKGEGLITHQADSWLAIDLPADGTYCVFLGDTQDKGGEAYGYRLRISAPRPDFALRVTPSTINARAGMTLPITVHALRKDGFSGNIELSLKDPPSGFRLSGAWVPAEQDTVELTLSMPPDGRDEPFKLHLTGRAVIDGREVVRDAIPADDLVQAFVIHHLVPCQDLLVAVTGRARSFPQPRSRVKGRFNAKSRSGSAGFQRLLLASIGEGPLQVPAGGAATLKLPPARSPLLDQVQFALHNPPPGLTLTMTKDGGGTRTLNFRADAKEAKPGLQGNLIVEVFVERTFKRAAGKPSITRRTPLGTLPAIRFEVVKDTR